MTSQITPVSFPPARTPLSTATTAHSSPSAQSSPRKSLQDLTLQQELARELEGRCFSLPKAFHGVKEFSLKGQFEPFSQRAISEIAAEILSPDSTDKSGSPYVDYFFILAKVKAPKKAKKATNGDPTKLPQNIRLLDACSFIRNRIVHEGKWEDPTTRQAIMAAQIYSFAHKSDKVRFWGTLEKDTPDSSPVLEAIFSTDMNGGPEEGIDRAGCQCTTGLYYETGEAPFDKDFDKALYWLERAAKNKSYVACLRLSLLFSTGQITKYGNDKIKNQQRAFMYKKLAVQYSRAAVEQARETFEKFQKRTSDARVAQFPPNKHAAWMAEMETLKESYEDMIDHFTKILYDIGHSHLFGEGIPKDIPQGLKYLEEAANWGLAPAKLLILTFEQEQKAKAAHQALEKENQKSKADGMTIETIFSPSAKKRASPLSQETQNTETSFSPGAKKRAFLQFEETQKKVYSSGLECLEKIDGKKSDTEHLRQQFSGPGSSRRHSQ